MRTEEQKIRISARRDERRWRGMKVELTGLALDVRGVLRGHFLSGGLSVKRGGDVAHDGQPGQCWWLEGRRKRGGMGIKTRSRASLHPSLHLLSLSSVPPSDGLSLGDAPAHPLRAS